VDSWTNGAHAVLRDDSEFGGDRSPSGDREAHPSHTQQAVVRAAGRENCAAQQATFRTLAGQISQAEVDRTAPQNHPADEVTSGVWEETSSTSEADEEAIGRREARRLSTPDDGSDAPPLTRLGTHTKGRAAPSSGTLTPTEVSR
jgi:hypothetical protein